MATRITITLPDRQLDEIRRRVWARKSASISGYIQQAIQKTLDNEAEFRAMLHLGLMKTGGPLKTREHAWAKRMLTTRATD